MTGLRSRALIVSVLLLVVLCAAGCAGARASHGLTSTRTATSSGGATQATATQPASPIIVTVTVQEQGAISAHNARLAIQVTIANNANKPIEILYPCGFDPIQFTVRDAATSAYISGSDTYSCPPSPSKLHPPAIAVGTTHIFPLTDDLSQATLAPGQYVLTVTVSWQDAQATITPPAPNPTINGSATQSVTITLR